MGTPLWGAARERGREGLWLGGRAVGRSLFASARLGPETPPVRTRAGGIQVQDRGRGNAEQCPGPEGGQVRRGRVRRGQVRRGQVLRDRCERSGRGPAPGAWERGVRQESPRRLDCNSFLLMVTLTLKNVVISPTISSTLVGL